MNDQKMMEQVLINQMWLINAQIVTFNRLNLSATEGEIYKGLGVSLLETGKILIEAREEQEKEKEGPKWNPSMN